MNKWIYFVHLIISMNIWLDMHIKRSNYNCKLLFFGIDTSTTVCLMACWFEIENRLSIGNERSGGIENLLSG